MDNISIVVENNDDDSNENIFLCVPCSLDIFVVKKSTNKGMSSRRSFNAGTLIKITANRWYKSSLKRPSEISFFKSLQ